MAVAMETPASGNTGKRLWAIAEHGVKKAVGMSLAFRTLRDMTGERAYVDPQQLTYVRELGEGAYATVELCTLQASDGTGRPVAVKRLKPEIFQSKEELRHFLDETDLLRRLRHSCIVDFLGVGATDVDALEGDVEHMRQKVYLIQEYMNGGTMKSTVLAQMGSGRGRVYTDKQAIQWLIHVAKGLRYLHTAKPIVIHRDIKLENILLKETDSGEVVAKLADFGLYALAGSTVQAAAENSDPAQPTEALLKEQSVDLGETLSGKTGSLMYMAPEVYNCQPYDESCDVFSLGTAMFEVCNRKMMSLMLGSMGDITSDEEYAQLIAAGKRPHIPSYWPAKLSALVTRCWEQEGHKRPSAEEIVKELEGIKEEGLSWTPSSSGCACCTIQ